MSDQSSTSRKSLWIAAAAAFSVYFCMYAFGKPLTAYLLFEAAKPFALFQNRVNYNYLTPSTLMIVS